MKLKITKKSYLGTRFTCDGEDCIYTVTEYNEEEDTYYLIDDAGWNSKEHDTAYSHAELMQRFNPDNQKHWKIIK